MLLAIILSVKSRSSSIVYATRYHKWYNEYRTALFPNIVYNSITELCQPGTLPKLPNQTFRSIQNKLKLVSPNTKLSHFFSERATSHKIFYFRAVQYWIKALDSEPFFEENGKPAVTGEMKPIYFLEVNMPYIAASIVSSSLYFTFYIVWSSCQVINARDFEFPFNFEKTDRKTLNRLIALGKQLQNDYQQHSDIKVRSYSKRGRKFTMRKQHFHIRKSKPIIDEIDRVLAEHYGFTDEELDFIINYDIKYRMGREGLEEKGEGE